MASTLITNIGELVTNDPALGDGSTLGIVRDAALVFEQGRVAWVGAAAEAPAADERVDAARPRRHPRLRRQPHAPRLRRRALGRVRGAHGRRELRRWRHRDHRGRDACRLRRPTCAPQPPRGCARCGRAARPPWRSRAATGSTSRPRSASCACRASSPPRRRSWARTWCRPSTRDDRAAYVDARVRPHARGVRPARPLGRRVLRHRRVRCRGDARRPDAREWLRGCSPGCTATSSASDLARRSPSSSALRAWITARTSVTTTSRRSRGRSRRDAAACRRVLDAVALRRRAPPARSRRHRRARHRLQPGQRVRHLDAVRDRARRTRDAHDTRRGAVVGDRRGRRRASPRRHRPPCAGLLGGHGRAGRADPRTPRVSPGLAARRGHLDRGRARARRRSRS